MAKECVCLTCCLGCRLVPQQELPFRRVNILWLCILFITGIYIWYWFYFWLLAENSVEDINWFCYNMLGRWIPAYAVLFSLTCVAFAYIMLLFISVLCHCLFKIRVDIHWLHVVLIIVILVVCIAVTVVLDSSWKLGYNLIALSLQLTAPFLQIGGVILATLLTWIVADLIIQPPTLTSKSTSNRVRLAFFIVYVIAMALLYLSPIFINSPCVCEADDLPSKPLLLAHKGASAIAPENTVVAFEYAAASNVLAFESDVAISFDGVPFVLHDAHLRRTTNVEEVFPSLSRLDACWFNMSQLLQLDAGSWFLKNDPFNTVSKLSSHQRSVFGNQTIPTLRQLLELSMRHNTSVMFDIKTIGDDACPGHPYTSRSEQIIVDEISRFNFTKSLMWWLYRESNETVGYRLVVADTSKPIDDFVNASARTVNFGFKSLQSSKIYEYSKRGIWVNIWTIDGPWLYSLCWCMGIDSITTNQCDTFAAMQQPVWHLTPQQYLIIWTVVDCVSFAIVVALWMFQWLRHRQPKNRSENVALVEATFNTPVDS